MESLNFEDHFSLYKHRFACEQEPTKDVIRKSWRAHAQAIFSPLRDLHLEFNQQYDLLKSKDAVKFLKYGVVARLLAIWHSYRSILCLACPLRTKPLTVDESYELSKDINLIYIHLRGVLDNYAWVYCYEKEPTLLHDRSRRVKKFIGLFHDDFAKKSDNQSFWNELNEYKNWAMELSNKRDPVAHRIPLYVVPSAIKSYEYSEYQDLEKERSEALETLDLNKAEETFSKQQDKGVFPVLFAHDPDDCPIDIYPTIPNDMANLIKIQKIVFKYMFIPKSE